MAIYSGGVPVLYKRLCEVLDLISSHHHSRSEHLTALRGQDRHIPVIGADRGIAAAEQLVQCGGEPDLSIVMHPSVITRSVGAVDAAGGLFVQKTERAQLRLTDGHGCDP